MLTKKEISVIRSEMGERVSGFPLVFEALGDPCRFSIFRMLMERHDMCVTDIANVCGMTASAASQQLRILERVGLVTKMRIGQMVCYQVNGGNPIAKQITKLLKESN